MMPTRCPSSTTGRCGMPEESISSVAAVRAVLGCTLTCSRAMTSSFDRGHRRTHRLADDCRTAQLTSRRVPGLIHHRSSRCGRSGAASRRAPPRCSPEFASATPSQYSWATARRRRMPVGCHLSARAVSRGDGIRQASVVVVRTVAFVILRRVLGLVGVGPAPDAKDVEIAVLRHQSMVLGGRSPGRATPRRIGRCWPSWRGYWRGTTGQ
jgi:hypothetical protein